MLNIIHSCLSWLLTLEIVGILAGVLMSFGVPAQAAPFVVTIALLAGIYSFWKLSTDRYMFQRWKRGREWRRTANRRP